MSDIIQADPISMHPQNVDLKNQGELNNNNCNDEMNKKSAQKVKCMFNF